MYRSMSGLGQDDASPDVRTDDPYVSPPSEPQPWFGSGPPSQGGGSSATTTPTVTWDANKAIDAVAAMFRGWTVRENVPHGPPGSGGCSPWECPVTQGSSLLAICKPCPQYGVGGFIAQSFVIPLIILGVVVLIVTSGRRR